MTSKIVIHNLNYLATLPVSKLAVNLDRMTLVELGEGMTCATEAELRQVIAHTERFYREKNRPLWLPLTQKEDGKRFGIETGKLLQKIKVEGLEKPLPSNQLEELPLVTFVLNRQKIKAYRELVARTSRVFERMLFGSFSEAKNDEIVLHGVNLKLFRYFTFFTETGRLPKIDDRNEMISLYSLAEQFQAESIEMALGKRLAACITPSELKDLFYWNSRFFSRTVPSIGAAKAKEIAKEIHSLVKDLEKNNDVEDKEALILNAKKALVAWINQAHLPIINVAEGKAPAEFFRWLGPSLHHLEYANFYNSPISNDALDMLQECPNLKSLNIAWCTQLKPDALDVLMHCKKLQFLNLSACRQLKPDALDVLIHCPDLEELDIATCTQLNPGALDPLGNCTRLHSLNINLCTQLKENALDMLTHWQNLKSLYMFKCDHLMETARIHLEQRPELKVII